jgi:hypothetical protein
MAKIKSDVSTKYPDPICKLISSYSDYPEDGGLKYSKILDKATVFQTNLMLALALRLEYDEIAVYARLKRINEQHSNRLDLLKKKGSHTPPEQDDVLVAIRTRGFDTERDLARLAATRIRLHNIVMELDVLVGELKVLSSSNVLGGQIPQQRLADNELLLNLLGPGWSFV